MKEITIQERNELKAYIESGELENAMYCAKAIGFYGIAAKIAKQRNEFELAGRFYALFGDYEKSLNCYLQSDKKHELAEVVDIAKKTNNAENVLKAEIFVDERIYTDQSKKQDRIYRRFKYGNYTGLDNYEKTIAKVKKNYVEELVEDNEEPLEIIKIYSELKEFDKLKPYVQKEINKLNQTISYLLSDKEILKSYLKDEK